MLRVLTTTLAALAIAALPLAAVAENQTAPVASETVVLAAVEDALPVAPTRTVAPRNQNAAVETEATRPAHGSSQSMASFRFSNAHAFPQQTLPLNFPTFPTFGF